MGKNLFAGLAAALACSWAFAGEAGPLPEPLTLEHALSLADRLQPDVSTARAEIAYSEAERQLAESRSGTRVSLEGRLRWIEPPDVAPDQSDEDHRASLFIRKNLYDFGRTEAYRGAANQAVQASRLRYMDTVTQRRTAIMASYFDVLLADMQFARDNENLATAYVALDRLRDRHELGQVSDLELFEMEDQYQAVRRQRAVSEALQRSTRSLLAIALDRPGELPAELARPDLPQLELDLPAYERLLEKALADNPVLQAMRADVESADQRLAAARAGKRPYLDAELEASDYAREGGSNDEWRAGLLLTVPLYTGGTVDAQVGKAKAELDKVRAAFREAERDVRQKVLETWLELQTLEVDAERVVSLQDYRDLYLDRSRALYEMEVKTDLGDAMVRLSEAQLEAARNRFERTLAWERLKALTGGLPADAADG